MPLQDTLTIGANGDRWVTLLESNPRQLRLQLPSRHFPVTASVTLGSGMYYPLSAATPLIGVGNRRDQTATRLQTIK